MTSSPERDRKILITVTLVVVLLVIFQTTNNVIKIYKDNNNTRMVEKNSVEYLSKPIAIGSATQGTGIARLCINTPPIITYDCNLSNAVLDTNMTYNCTFNATDPNGDAVTFDAEWQTSPKIFNVTPEGYYNFSPKRAAMNQTNTVWIRTYDNSGCSWNSSYIELNMTVVGINRPPYLVQNIPNEQIIKNRYALFSLNNYFTDPDEDTLAYFYSITQGSTVRVRVFGGNAEIKGLDCGVSIVYFIAVDPLGLTAISNNITYEVTCPQINPGSNNTNNEDSGDGDGYSRECDPDWRCSKWSQCMPWNLSYKKCLDFNACNPYHYEEYLFQNCTYEFTAKQCEEKWDCSNWDLCKEGTHTRMCLDTNTCGTNKTKPAESENCTIIASCYNGVQDADEEGVDCGGACTACRNVEKPAKTNNLNTIMIITGILTLATTGLVIYITRAKILAFYKRIFTKKPKIKRRTYINNKQKEKLLQLLNIIQARIDEHKINHAIDESSVFIKEYFKQLLSLDNLNKQELITNIVKLKDKDLEKLLVMFYAKITSTVHLRNRGAEILESEVQAMIDEMSHEIYLLAEFTEEEAVLSTKNRNSHSKATIDIIYTKLSNLYIALKFGELISAKNIYKDLLKDYDKLSDKEKHIPYTDIIRAFHAIYYLETKLEE